MAPFPCSSCPPIVDSAECLRSGGRTAILSSPWGIQPPCVPLPDAAKIPREPGNFVLYRSLFHGAWPPRHRVNPTGGIRRHLPLHKGGFLCQIASGQPFPWRSAAQAPDQSHRRHSPPPPFAQGRLLCPIASGQPFPWRLAPSRNRPEHCCPVREHRSTAQALGPGVARHAWSTGELQRIQPGRVLGAASRR